MDLRLTTAGRALLADSANTGLSAVRLTHLALGSGSAAAGSANDGRTALRTERDRVAVSGVTSVAGRVAYRGDFSPSVTYSVTEAGLFGRVGASGAVTLLAYWTAGGTVLASAIAGTALTVAGVLEVQSAAADVTVTVTTTVQLGDPALTARVTAVETDLAALQAAAITAATIERYTMPAEIEVRMSTANGETAWTLASEGLAVSGVTVTDGANGYITFGPGVYRITGRDDSDSGVRNDAHGLDPQTSTFGAGAISVSGFEEYGSSSIGDNIIDDIVVVAAGASKVVRPAPRVVQSVHIGIVAVFIRRIGDAPA